MFTLYFLVI
jgi:hypothetical protein